MKILGRCVISGKRQIQTFNKEGMRTRIKSLFRSQHCLNIVKTFVSHRSLTKLKGATLYAEGEGITINTVLLQGDPASEILGYADEEKYDVIIMGSRGMGRLKELVLGSVSNKIFHNSVSPRLNVHKAWTRTESFCGLFSHLEHPATTKGLL